MTKYYAVCDPIRTYYRYSPGCFQLYRAGNVVLLSSTDIIRAYQHSKTLALFYSEQDAIAYAIATSRREAGYHTYFYSPPVIKIDCHAEAMIVHDKVLETANKVIRFAEVDPCHTTLLAGKMVYVGKKRMADLPYQPCESQFTHAEALAFKPHILKIDNRLTMAMLLSSSMGILSLCVLDDTVIAALTALTVAYVYIKHVHENERFREEHAMATEVQRLKK